MKIPLVGPSYQQRSLPFDAQRTVNLIAIMDKKGADVSSFLGSPGLTLFATVGNGPIRNQITAGNGRFFCVSGPDFYEVTSAGVSTTYGTLLTTEGAITFADNGTQLGICDGTSVYIFTYATNAFAKVTDADLPTSGGIDFVDGYFIVNQVDTGKFYISDLYNGASWNALNFATAESSPDKLIRAVNFLGQIGLFGENTLEIWRNTGDTTFPFSRISGSTPIGTKSPYSIITIDNSIYWVGNTLQGGGIVYRAQGFTPVRISNEIVERRLRAVADPTALRSWAYQEDGHSYLMITGSDLETTWCYDLSTSEWHERASLGSDGGYDQHRGAPCAIAFGKILVGDRVNGKIYEMKLDYYTDNGTAIPRRRIYTHLIDELKDIRYSQLRIGFETGVGLQTGNGSDPVVSLRISKDGGRTWSNYYSVSIGRAGQTNQQVVFRRLGIMQQCTFEITISDPVKVAITGSYLE